MPTIPPPVAAGLYWTSQLLQRDWPVRHRLALLARTQSWSPQRLQDFQLHKLRSLLRHSYDTVPYYREVMDRHGVYPEQVHTLEDFRRLPFLDRATVRERTGDLLSRAAGSDLVQGQSSGSTGERVSFYQDRDFNRWCRAHQLRTYQWCGGWQIGEPFALVWGSPTYFERRPRTAGFVKRLSNRIELNSFRLDRFALERMLDRVVAFRPRLISGYTTALYLLARLARERGVRLEGLRAVQPNAEPLAEPMRAEMEQVFGCPVFDKYGSRETNIVAHESPMHDGLRIQAEHTLVEIFDQDGNPCVPGQVGRLVVTTLNNRAMPLLRYQTTDLAAPLSIPEGSALGLPAMTAVAGRRQDVLCTPDGGFIHPQLFSNVLRQFDAVDWFQVVQQREDTLVLRVLARSGLTDEDSDRIIALIRDLAGFDFRITFDVLADMPASTTGKHRLCVYDVPAIGRDHDLALLNQKRRNPHDP